MIPPNASLVFEVELLELEGVATIHSYSLHNVLAEKMRSLLQQPIRKRKRRQDVYDIWLLLASVEGFTAEEQAQIHQMLVDSCRSKGIEPTAASMDDKVVVEMAREVAETMLVEHPELAEKHLQRWLGSREELLKS